MLQNVRNRWGKIIKSLPEIFWILALELIVFSFISPHFASVENVFNLMRQCAVLVIISMGMLFVITSGGIDLSVGSLIGLSGTITAYLSTLGIKWWIAVLVGVAVCSLAGLISGLIISKGKIFPYVVTFGMLFIVRSVSLGFTQGGSLHIQDANINLINSGYFLNLPNPFWIILVTVILCVLLMKWTVFGRYIFSIGSDSTTASWMGIKVDAFRTLVYFLSGTLAGIAGVILASRVNTGNALIGQDTQFFAIAAVVIGGTPISGGRGKLLGAILGALVINSLQNGLTLLGFSSELTTTVVGITLMVGVIFAQIIYLDRGESRGKSNPK